MKNKIIKSVAVAAMLCSMLSASAFAAETSPLPAQESTAAQQPVSQESIAETAASGTAETATGASTVGISGYTQAELQNMNPVSDAAIEEYKQETGNKDGFGPVTVIFYPEKGTRYDCFITFLNTETNKSYKVTAATYNNYIGKISLPAGHYVIDDGGFVEDYAYRYPIQPLYSSEFDVSSKKATIVQAAVGDVSGNKDGAEISDAEIKTNLAGIDKTQPAEVVTNGASTQMGEPEKKAPAYLPYLINGIIMLAAFLAAHFIYGKIKSGKSDDGDSDGLY